MPSRCASPAMVSARYPIKSRAEERSCLRVGVARWQRKTIPAVRDNIFGIAPIELITGELRVVAQVFASDATITACPHVQPSHGTPTRSPIAKPVTPTPSADGADDLVTWHHRAFGVLEFAVDDMEIGAAHAARVGVNQQLAGACDGVRDVQLPQASKKGECPSKTIARMSLSSGIAFISLHRVGSGLT